MDKITFRFDGVSALLMHSDRGVKRAALISAAENGGRFIGLGDFRPANGGPFGRFSVTAS